MKMKKAILLVMMLTIGFGSVFAQTDYDTISATYTVEISPLMMHLTTLEQFHLSRDFKCKCPSKCCHRFG